MEVKTTFHPDGWVTHEGDVAKTCVAPDTVSHALTFGIKWMQPSASCES
jgi:hypothetical protein